MLQPGTVRRVVTFYHSPHPTTSPGSRCGPVKLRPDPAQRRLLGGLTDTLCRVARIAQFVVAVKHEEYVLYRLLGPDDSNLTMVPLYTV